MPRLISLVNHHRIRLTISQGVLIMTVSHPFVQRVSKGWGEEVIFTNSLLYCGKILKMQAGSRMSMHFHQEKDETWYVLKGSITLVEMNLYNAEQNAQALKPGDVVHISPFTPHQAFANEDSEILEVSTRDRSVDNYRIIPGDSQHRDAQDQQAVENHLSGTAQLVGSPLRYDLSNTPETD